MPLPQEARPRARSAFTAAFLSLLFPGLGHAYLRAYHRALAFAAPPILAIALIAGIALRMDRLELAGMLVQSWVLTSIFVVNLVFLVYRVVAVIDAYRVAQYLNAVTVAGDGRLGRPRIPLNPVSAAGLLAVILVMAGGHVAVARYDLLVSNTADCIFDLNRDCSTATPSPSGGSPLDTDAEPTDAAPSVPSAPVGSDVPDVTAPPWNGKDRLNILLIGADEQGGGHNTDTMIVVSIDPVAKQVAMFSLPRDTVDIPVPNGPAQKLFGTVYRGKINSWFATVRRRPDLFPGTEATRGYNGLKAILGNLYGLDVNYFVEVNFDGFKKVVDALGGVTINVQMPVLDDYYPGDRSAERIYIPAGVQHMTGAQALVYARSRHASTDYDRGQRQQRVLLSLRQQVNVGAVLPHLDELAAAVGSALRTDIPRELMPQLLGLAEGIDTHDIRSYVFSPRVYGTEGSRQGLGFVIFPDIAKIRAAVASAFKTDPAVEARREKLSEEDATVWVLNGSGSSGQASGIAAYLTYLGTTASAPNQAPSGGTRSATTVIAYNGAETDKPETAALLASTFGVTVQPVTDPNAHVDFVVTTGRSTPSLTPPPAP